MNAPLRDQRRIIESGKKRNSIVINDGSIDHAYKIYSLTIETQEIVIEVK